MKHPFLHKLTALSLLLALVITLFVPYGATAASTPIRITCVGDSITQGVGASDESVYSYPAQMQTILGEDFEVFNAGVANTVALQYERGYKYNTTAKYTAGKEFLPNIVIIALGTNDAHGTMWDANAPTQFRKDYKALVQEYLDLPTSPLVLLSLPMTTTDATRQKNNTNGTIPAIKEIAAELGLPVIDMQTFTKDHPEWFPDGLHPGDAGYTKVAEEMAKHVLAEAEKAGLLIKGTEILGTALAYDDFVQEGNHLHYLMPKGIDITDLAPGFEIHKDSTITPAAAEKQDFSRSVTYTVTAADGQTETYQVHVYSLDSIKQSDRNAARNFNDLLKILPEEIYLYSLSDALPVLEAYRALTPLQKMLLSDRLAAETVVERVEEIQSAPIRITCVGDSITQGVGASDESTYSYPAQMQNILGEDYAVLNAGVSNTVVLQYERGYKYNTTAKYTAGKEFLPDMVIIALGTNDAHGTMWDAGAPAQFRTDYRTLVQEYLDLPSKPTVLLSLPMTTTDGDRQKNNTNGTIPAIKEIAAELGLTVIDMQTFTKDHTEWFPDGLHPNDVGYAWIAGEMAQYVTAATERFTDHRAEGLLLDGAPLEAFTEKRTDYTVELTDGDALPEVQAVLPENGLQKVTVRQATAQDLTATVTVQSVHGDGKTVYTVTFILPEPEVIFGDVDASGKVDVGDIMKLKALIMADRWTEEELAIGDMDASGQLDVGDIMVVKNIIMAS